MMPSRPYSTAIWRVSWMSPALLTAYAAWPGAPTMPCWEVMFTIRPRAGPRAGARGPRGCVAQHVQPPGLCRGAVDQPVAVLPVRDIGGQVLAGAAAGPDEIVGGLAAGDRITADVGEQHPEAVRG